MPIRPIDLDARRDVSRYVRFPLQLYRGNAYWVPPLLADARAALDPTHPSYQHIQATFFVAEARGRVVGRLAMMENQRYNAYVGVPTALFGQFEAIEDQAVVRDLFDAGRDWARRRGLVELRGPQALIGTDAEGILVEGFDQHPAMGVPYNPPYYDEMLSACGLTKVTDHLSGYLPAQEPLPERLHRVARLVRVRRGIEVRTLPTKAALRELVPRLMSIYVEAFSQNHAFFPPTAAEIEKKAESLLAIADPRYIMLAFKGDEPIGFLFAYPNIGAGLRRARGRLWPLGWWHLLRERNRTPYLDVNGVGVLPEYQGLGVNALLYTALEKAVAGSHFLHGDIVQVDEANFRSRSDMEAMGVRWTKRHRHYSQTLESAAP